MQIGVEARHRASITQTMQRLGGHRRRQEATQTQENIPNAEKEFNGVLPLYKPPWPAVHWRQKQTCIGKVREMVPIINFAVFLETLIITQLV
jgi:hypothetical protein